MHNSPLDRSAVTENNGGWAPASASGDGCGILLVKNCVSAGDRAAIINRWHRGELVAVARGAYVDASNWEALNRHDRYRLRVRAASEILAPPTVFSHHSAAALWRLPIVGEWPNLIHIAEAKAPGGRSSAAVFRHTTGVTASPDVIDGLRVTSLSKTVVDMARATDFGTAVTLTDAALRRSTHPLDDVPPTHLSRTALLEELALVPLRHGSARAKAVIDFADGRADRPGESMSRVSMHVAKLPAPQLQIPLRGQSGRTWIADFWWPECNLIGEFDGRWKYSDPEFLRGRTSHQVLLDEKSREDDLRAKGFHVSRWDWSLALSPIRLKAHLIAAGLR